MAGYRYPIVAPIGQLVATALALAALDVGLRWGVLAAAPLAGLLPVVLYLFRDPVRSVPATPLAVVSPVDGSVLSVAHRPHPWLEGEGLQIRLRMSPLGVYSVRSPVEGKVLTQWFPGDPHGAPGCFTQWTRTDEGDDLLLALTRTRFAAVQCDVAPGERIGQGQRCGFVTFGTRVELWLPPSARPEVAAGDSVLSGTSVLASLRHGEDTVSTAIQG